MDNKKMCIELLNFIRIKQQEINEEIDKKVNRYMPKAYCELNTILNDLAALILKLSNEE